MKIESFSFEKNKIVQDGNKYIIGNGYLGYRGTLDEYTKDQLVALNLPGVYDQQPDKWCESINAFNPFYTYIEVDGKRLSVLDSEIKSHYQGLTLDEAIFERKTEFNNFLTIASNRFVSINYPNLLAMEYQVIAPKDIKIDLYTGIDLDVWDINGPHLENILTNVENNELVITANSIERKIPLLIKETFENACQYNVRQEIVTIDQKFLRKFSITLKANIPFVFHKLAMIEYGDTIKNKPFPNYHDTLEQHKTTFKTRFDKANVVIEGDELAKLGASYSIYHLLIIAPFHKSSASIPARGISGQVYKGAIFWDTEMFMLPFYLLIDPKLAKPLLQYRIDTVNGAKQKAKELGYTGAYYAWESIEGGIDACTLFNVTDPITNRPLRTYFKDKQIHISADIIYALDRYLEYTLDYDLLLNGGFQMTYEVVKFYYSYLYYSPIKDKYVVLDVTGPDEYHERVNNNAYTNRMIKKSFEFFLKQIEIIKSYDKEHHSAYYQTLNEQENLDEFVEKVVNINKKLYIPHPNTDLVIEQFDNYYQLNDVTVEDIKKQLLHPNEYLGGASGLASPTKIIKQADVITMLCLFDEYSKEVIKANFDYYLPRTEHGSSLSASMYAIAACMVGNSELAYQYYLQSALIDYYGGGKQYAGSIYIGGTHPAASGGAYLTLVYGFAGLKIVNEKVTINPCLPKAITRLKFRILYREEIYEINISKEEEEVKKVSEG